jgi:protein-tyrosine phosphatase
MNHETRRLAWADLHNARDLGGLPAAGGRTAFQSVVRTDRLDRLTEAGRAALLAYGVATIVDLRSTGELLAAPSPLRDMDGYRHLPFLDEAAIHHANRFESAIESYLWQLENRMSLVAAAIHAIAEAPPGCVLVHCAAGKDRTGIVSALVLSVAGVDRATIAADYALSTPWLDAARDGEEGLGAQPDAVERARLRRVYESRPETILGLLAAVDSRHGGIAGYLTAIGVGEGAQDRLRARLR